MFDPYFPCLILAFLAFHVLHLFARFASPLDSLLLSETNSKDQLTRGPKLMLWFLFIIDASNFFIFLNFPSTSSSRQTFDLSPPFSPIFLYFHK